MARGVERVLFTSGVGGVLLAALYVAKDWPIRASILILFLGSIGVVLALVQLAGDLRALRAGAVEAKRPTYEVETLEHGGRWGSLEIWAWLWGLFAAIQIVGLPVALPLFVFLYCFIYSGRWITASVLAGGTWGFLYGLFEQVLHVPWPEPLLQALFR